MIGHDFPSQVGDVRWPFLAAVSVDASVQEAADELAALDIGALGVTQDDEIVGVISERDIVRACTQRMDLAATKVASLMSRAPHTIPWDAPIRDAALTMVMARVRHLPVVRAGRVVGMVSARDVLKVLAERDVS